MTTTRVAIKPDSGPKTPPPIMLLFTWLNFNNEGVVRPLTWNPKMIPCEKFHAV